MVCFIMIFMIYPALGEIYYDESYDVHLTFINVSDLYHAGTLINLTYIRHSLPFIVNQFYIENLDIIPTSMRLAMNESPMIIDGESFFNWSIFAGYKNQLPLFRETTRPSIKVALIGKTPCHFSNETCFASSVPRIEGGSMRFFNTQMNIYEEPYLAMRDVWQELNELRIQQTGSSIDSNITDLINEIVPDLIIDVAPPYTERINIENIHPLLYTSYELVFAQCGVEIENIVHIIGELRRKLPSEFKIEYRVVDCDAVELSEFSLSLEKIPYVIENPGLFNFQDYTDSSKIPILMYNSLDNISEAYPLFIVKSCEGTTCYAGEDMLKLIGGFFGIRDHNIPNCVMGQGLYFDDICDEKIDMIFDDFRKDVMIRDAIARINFLNRVDFILDEAEGSPLRYFPGYEVLYDGSIDKFKDGKYLELIEDIDSFVVDIREAGFWNTWAETVWNEISSVKGEIGCEICGDGCYGGPGLCCLSTYYYDASCCINEECGVWSLCEDNICVLNTDKVVIYFRDTIWWAGPPIAIIFLMLVFRKRIIDSYIRFVYKRMRKKGMQEDKIYTILFNRGYKKEHIQRALKGVEMTGVKRDES